jgi:hypothetical protein
MTIFLTEKKLSCSSNPFLCLMSLLNQTTKTLRQLYLTSFSFISGIIVFGGLVAPVVSHCTL